MRPFCDKLVSSCAALVNLQTPIISGVFDKYSVAVSKMAEKVPLGALLLGGGITLKIQLAEWYTIESEKLLETSLYSLSKFPQQLYFTNAQ